MALPSPCGLTMQNEANGMNTMADDADTTGERMDFIEREALKRVAEQAKLDPGVPGECDMCGEWYGRLIKGVCCPCRDKHKLG